MRQLKISKSITNRESESLEKYLQEISKVNLVTPEEEVQLVALIKKGDRSARERLVKANLRFVVSVAKQYQGQGLSLPDLINEGNLGLIKSVSRFDESRGFKFISFAVWWIRQSIIHALAEHSRTIRLPLHKVAMRGKVQRVSSSLEQQLERAPSDEELAEALNIGTDDVAFSLGMNNRPLSLDTPLTEDDDGTLIDTLENTNAPKADEELYHTDSLRTELARSFQILNQRQKETLCYFFGIGVDYPLSLDEIGKKFHLTTERVRQIKEKAIGKLKTTANFNELKSYLRA